MKIGVFDSGLGGLAITKSLIEGLPEESFVYLGDTKRVPYGTRSLKTVVEFTCEGLEFLFEQGVDAVVVACNTASTALDQVQASFPDKRIWGVIEPTVQAASRYNKVAIIATPTTISTHLYLEKLRELNPTCEVTERPAPLLVPIIENKEMSLLGAALDQYLEGLRDQEALILGCTHYPLIRKEIEKRLPDVAIIDQTELIPAFIRNQLNSGEVKPQNRFFVTDLTENFRSFAEEIFGYPIDLEAVDID